MNTLRKKILLSAGPMRANLDAVRFLQNRSSGRMALEIAREAARRGAEVQVLLGPVEEAIRRGFQDFAPSPYETAAQYGAILQERFAWCDAFLSVAAVLDFEPVPLAGKLNREELGAELRLALSPVPDFVAWAGSRKRVDQKVVAFAAETGDTASLLKKAHAKRIKKNADAIVANPVQPGLGPEALDNELWILRPDLPPVHLGPAPKAALAAPLLQTLFDP